MTSPIAVLGIMDFGTNWGERVWIASVAERHQFWQVNPLFHFWGDLRVRGPIEAQTGIAGEGGGKGPNIPEGLRQEIRGG